MGLNSGHIYTSVWLGGLVVFLVRWQRRVKDLPPGPPKLPFVGNLFTMPRLEAGGLAAMAKDYGSDIIHFEALGTSFVVLNTRGMAEELLDKRSGIYSSRPQTTMYQLCGLGFQFSSWEYGDRWRNARKLFTQTFNSPHIHRPREVAYIHLLLKKLLDTPKDYYTHLRHVPGSITLEMTYGMKVQSTHDPYVELAGQGSLEASLIFSQTWLVDLFPVLRHLPQWFPGAGFQKRAASCRKLVADVVDKPFNASQALLKSGRYEPSFVTEGLEDISNHGGDPEFLKRVAAMVYLAGSDTTTASLGTFFLAMVLHPEIQAKAQRELDEVLDGTLPRHEDMASLPYLQAVLLEVHRWKPVVPLGLPHVIDSEDIFGSYRIPAGTIVIPNQWAMTRDEKDYPDPERFNPERFLKHGKIDPSVKNPMELAFGFGRRGCPGRHIAHSILQLTAATVLSTFNLMKKKDEHGNVIEPAGEYRLDTIYEPLEFPCEIVPRSQHAIDLIQALDG